MRQSLRVSDRPVGVAQLLVVGVVALAWSCTSNSAPTAAPGDPEISIEAAARAEELLELGWAIEPDLTRWLVTGTDRLDLQLFGLLNRVKSQESLERKIQAMMLAQGLPADDVVIEDVLRYTLLVADEPPGTYNDVVRDVLARVERRGHSVTKVKNYWPAGDAYSGINCVLAAPEGLRWELQFHTVGSLAAKDEGHDLYEMFRSPTTPLRERRRLFDEMVERWSWVRIPQGILEPNSVHSREEIILRPRP